MANGPLSAAGFYSSGRRCLGREGAVLSGVRASGRQSPGLHSCTFLPAKTRSSHALSPGASPSCYSPMSWSEDLRPRRPPSLKTAHPAGRGPGRRVLPGGTTLSSTFTDVWFSSPHNWAFSRVLCPFSWSLTPSGDTFPFHSSASCLIPHRR